MTAAEFKKTLAELRLSQAEAARRLKVSANAVWMWCKGERKVPESAAMLVCGWIREATAVAFTVVFRQGEREHVYLIIANERPELGIYVASAVPMSEGAEIEEPIIMRKDDAADAAAVGRYVIMTLATMPSNSGMEERVYGPRKMLTREE